MKRYWKLFGLIGMMTIVLTGCRFGQVKENENHEEITAEFISEPESEVLKECKSEIPAAESEETQKDVEKSKIEIVPAEKSDLVKVQDYIPDIHVELKYNTNDNFTGQIIYEFSDAYLRYGTVEKLMQVQEVLRERGLSLKIWDAYRPTEAQFVLWEICPDATYVANPNSGFSSHSRGNTVDITIVDKDGNELIMPTGFDDFSTLADRDYSDCSEEASLNAKMLEQIMFEKGFEGYFKEWWHFSDSEKYPVEENLE